MWLPAPVYEALPGLYFCVGILGAVAMDDPLGWLLGGVLATVGVLIWIARRRNRQPIIGSRIG